MRIFKFFAVFLTVLGLVYTVIIGVNLNVFKTVFTNQEALAEGSEWVEKTYSLAGIVDFIKAHPDLVSVTLNDVESDTIRMFNNLNYGDENARTMGGLGHFILLATYASEVINGRISEDQLIPVTAINRFFVPNFEPNKHRESIELLQGLAAPESEMRLDDIVAVMIRRNHQPSADLVYSILGKKAVQEFMDAHVQGTIERPALWSAFHLATAASGQTSHLSGSFDDYSMYYDQFEHRLLTESDIESEIMLKAMDVSKIEYSFFEEKNAYRSLPKATPTSFDRFIHKMFTDESFGLNFSEIIKRHLAWSMDNPKVSLDFKSLYAMYDNRISISNGMAVGTSVYTERTQITSVFFDQLPVGFWMHMSSNLINQDFQMRLMYDPAMFERTYSMLMLNESGDQQTEIIPGDK